MKKANSSNGKIRFKSVLSLSFIFILLIGFNLILVHLPLTNLLGYEFSALNALLIFFLSGVITLSWLKNYQEINITLIIILISLIFIPLVIITVYSLITKFCSFPNGLLFYSVITLPSGYLGFATALFVQYVSLKFRIIIFSIIFLSIAVIPVLEIYFYPQVYFYNPLVTFFPGTIYDESLTVSLKMLLYRLLNIGFAASVVYLVMLDKQRNKVARNIAIILLVPVMFFFISPYLGFSTNFLKLKKVLHRGIETPEFSIHNSDSVASNEAMLISLHTQYYFEKLTRRIGETPTEKVDIFIFDSRLQKRELFGAGNADVAKPWLYQIYINQDNWQSTLEHELAHIFSAEFGSTVFKLSGDFNPFLIEGFASAVDPFRDGLEVDYLTFISDSALSTENFKYLLTGFNFFAVNSFKTYTYAGSLSKYLIDNFGIDRFKKYYQTNDFVKTYGIDSKEIVEQYLISLNEMNFKPNQHKQNYYFGRKSIVQKFCVRSIASAIEDGWEHVYHKRFEKAKKSFRSVLSVLPNYHAVTGLAECFLQQDSPDSAASLIQNSIEHFDKTPYHYLLKYRLADILVLTDQIPQAIRLYNDLFLKKPSMNLELNSAVRIQLHNHNLLKDFISGNDSIKFVLLKKINEKEYYYPSIPILIRLAQLTGSDYEAVKKLFNKTFIINSFYSAYAVYKLSDYMMMNYDFRNARKFASLSLRHKELHHYNQLWKNNFEKAEWFYYNADKFINQFNNGD